MSSIWICRGLFALLLAATAIAANDRAVSLDAGGRPVASYVLRSEPELGLQGTGGFLHPFLTPAGRLVTDLSPADHKHHRGVFFAWLDVRGIEKGDFWGWGRFAPIAERRIVNRSVERQAGGLRAHNDWLARETVLLKELVEVSVRAVDAAHVMELAYTFTAPADTVLGRAGFGGLCLRLRKEGDVTFYSPKGVESRPNPKPTQPETDWPDAPWYAAVHVLPDGTSHGAAVVNRPGNPPTLWHIQNTNRMINPCVTASGDIPLAKGATLNLRYTVVAFDGKLPRELLDDLGRR